MIIVQITSIFSFRRLGLATLTLSMWLNSETLQRGETLASFKLSLRPHTGAMSYSYSEWMQWLNGNSSHTTRVCLPFTLNSIQTNNTVHKCLSKAKPIQQLLPCLSMEARLLVPYGSDFFKQDFPKVHAKHYATHQNQTAYRGPSDTEPTAPPHL